MLRVAVTSWYSGLMGTYVLDGEALTWEGAAVESDPFAGDMERILGEDKPNTWITRDDPERWLRRLPGFLAMRGHITAEIVEDS